MKRYRGYHVNVITESMTIHASSTEEAEKKYNAFWFNDPCIDHPQTSVQLCGCITDHNDGDVSHTIEEI